MKLALITAFGVGYVVGTRAGRERYEQLVTLARRASDGFEAVGPQIRLEDYAGRLEAFASRTEDPLGGSGNGARQVRGATGS